MTFNFLLFEGKGRLHAYHDKAMIDYRWENLFQACLNEFAVTEIDRDSVIIDLDYLFAGLVTITLSCLVHCMLQGVKHTDPTAWSNSHLLQWRQIHIGCLKNSRSFQGLFIAFFQQYLLVFHVRTALQHFILLNALSPFKMAFTTYNIYNMLFCKQLGHILIIFQRYQYDITIQHKLSIYTPCVSALILSECTNSSYQAARTALSRTAPNIMNLDLLLVT